MSTISVYETIKAGERFLSQPLFECAAEREEQVLQIGQRVILHGLQSSELNGKSGRVLSYVAAEGRVEVKLDDYQCPVKVTPDHLLLEDAIIPGSRVILQGLNTVQMNGKTGTVKRYMADQGRWEVELDEFDLLVKVLPYSIKLEPKLRIGDRVTLRDLKSEDMNGKCGKLTCYNEDVGRWEVLIDGDDLPVQVTAPKLMPTKPSKEEEKDQSIKPGSRVTFNGEKLSLMHGRSGSVKNFVADEGRWEVEMDGDEFTVKVKPEALTIEDDIKDDTKENSNNDNKAKKSKSEKKEKKKKRFFGRSRSTIN